MSSVIYRGPSNFRELSKADFAKAGVEEQNKITFARDIPEEVSDEVATALLDNESGLFGQGEFELAEDADPEEAKEAKKRAVAKKSAPKGSPAGGSTTDVTPVTGGGNGASTGGGTA